MILQPQAALSAPEPYAYPLDNPFEATIAGTPNHLQAQVPEPGDIRQQDFELPGWRTERMPLPENLWPVRSFRYRLAWQDGPAPLIFLIGGTGAPYHSSHTQALKAVFYGAGYHVVQLSSPTSYDFMASVSRRATPGLSDEDARDLYQVMRAIRSRHPELEIREYQLAGYSLGALHAAWVSHLDESLQQFAFSRVMLLNPPVNLQTSSHNLDRLVEVHIQTDSEEQENFYELILDRLSRYFRDRGHISLDEAILYDFQQSPYRLSDEQMAMLIGSVFRLSVADISFTSDLLNHRGLIIPANYPLAFDSSLTPFFKQALLCNFGCYMRQQVYPAWRQRHSGSIRDMIRQISLYPLADYLASSPKIAVQHNADDFILNPEDIEFLRQTFGPRLRLYPRGGHCGNLNFHTNVQHMLEHMHHD